MSTSMASELRELATKIDKKDPAVMKDASQKAQRIARYFWSKRQLPQGCKDLVAFMDGSAEQQKVEIKVIQPNLMSAYVAFIWRDGALEAVAKQRGKTPEKAAREECHYSIAQFLGAGSVAAPCIGMELNLWEKGKETSGMADDTKSDPGSVCALLASKMGEAFTAIAGACPPSTWVTVEKCVPIAPPGGGAGIGERLANKYGCCDIQQAFAATPAGQAAGLKVVVREHAPTDAEFYDMVTSLRVESVHRLCLLLVTVMQRDGSGPNLMIRELAGGSGKEKYEVIAIDPTTCLGTLAGDKLHYTDDADSSDPAAYWYPVALGLPQTSQPWNSEVKAELLKLKPADLQKCISDALTCSPGCAFSQADADAKFAAERLTQLQALVQGDANITVRECCFRIVPSWKADWDTAAKDGSLLSLPELEACGDAATYAKKCCAPKKGKQNNLPLIIVGTLMVAAFFSALSKKKA